MVRKADELANLMLSQSAMRVYVELVVRRIAKLIAYPIVIEPEMELVFNGTSTRMWWLREVVAGLAFVTLALFSRFLAFSRSLSLSFSKGKERARISWEGLKRRPFTALAAVGH